jgi:ribonucleoside-diphosphate reductase alpha chain
MAKYCFGVDIGGTTVKIGLFNSEETLVDKWEIVTRKDEGGSCILPDIAKAIEGKMQEMSIAKEDIVGIGIGVPGPITSEGKVLKCVNLGWGIFNVAEEVTKLTGIENVKVGNDANVAALGEMWKGGGRGYENMVMVTLGTGVGGGIIINGDILAGSNGAAGEIGHITVNYNEEDACGCGKKGCLEQFASATGIVKEANRLLFKSDKPSHLRDIQYLSAKAIFDCAKDLARTYSYGGGVGIDISKLAPKGAKVRNAAKESSGATSFMDLYSMVTGLIAQAGRRGALMISMSCDHPDIEEFIDIKKDLDKVTKANISVRVTDEFMNAAVNNQNFTMSFVRKETGEKFEKVVNARDVLMKLAYNNWDMGEPGILFWDRIESWNLLSEYDNFKYAGTNPCAEEPLPAGGSCLLGSLNLSEFVTDSGDFDFEALADATFNATIALNEVLDEGLPLHPLKIQRDSVSDWRQIGLGVFGIADMLVKMGIRYGSNDSIELCSDIATYILNYSMMASATLSAQNNKSFPNYRENLTRNSKFYRNKIWEATDNAVKNNGLYNSQLLTIAPTGTLSTMLGVSGGIEPIFANSYTRKTESLHGEDHYYKVYTPIVSDYMKKHNIEREEDLPDFFITAKDLNHSDRIKMQKTWQECIDASISSTINLPYEATPEDVFNIYVEAWKSGLKGITVFRDGCRRASILSTETHKEENKDNKVTNGLARGEIIVASDKVIGKKRKLTTGCGSLHVTAFFDAKTGDLMETYLSKGSSGGCNNYMIGLSRMMSLAARAGCNIHNIVDQLDSCGVCPSYAVRKATKHDTSKGSCCPMAVGNALLEMWKEMQEELSNKPIQNRTETTCKKSDKAVNIHKCPECGEPITHEGGCNICKSCGWSKCD